MFGVELYECFSMFSGYFDWVGSGFWFVMFNYNKVVFFLESWVLVFGCKFVEFNGNV